MSVFIGLLGCVVSSWSLFIRPPQKHKQNGKHDFMEKTKFQGCSVIRRTLSSIRMEDWFYILEVAVDSRWVSSFCVVHEDKQCVDVCRRVCMDSCIVSSMCLCSTTPENTCTCSIFDPSCFTVSLNQLGRTDLRRRRNVATGRQTNLNIIVLINLRVQHNCCFGFYCCCKVTTEIAGVESYHSTSGSITWTSIILLHQLTHKHRHTPAGGEKKHSVYWFLDEHRSHAQLIVLWGVAAPIIIRLQVEINAETRGWRKEEVEKKWKPCFSFSEEEKCFKHEEEDLSCSDQHRHSTWLFIRFHLVHSPAAVRVVQSHLSTHFLHSCCCITRCRVYQSTAETPETTQRSTPRVCECRLCDDWTLAVSCARLPAHRSTDWTPNTTENNNWCRRRRESAMFLWRQPGGAQLFCHMQPREGRKESGERRGNTWVCDG